MSNWKTEFYQTYYSHFGRVLDKRDYQLFEPYGRYLVKKCFPNDKEAKILDMGCGIGGFIKVSRDLGYSNIVGIDASLANISFATQNGLDNVFQEDIFKFFSRTKSEVFDVILLLDVLEHFHMEEVVYLLKETHRILKPQGRLILHVPNASGIFGSKIRYADITHELSFTTSSLTQLTKYAGFKSQVGFEDKPVVHGMISLARRILWELMSMWFRVLHAAETGSFNVILSQNFLFIASKD